MEREKLVVKRWLSTGELGPEHGLRTEQEILDAAGNALDHASSGEIVGDAVFEATDGKFYAIHVEAVIDEVEESHARNITGT